MKLYCSFCGKSQDEVRKLVAGPTAHICNECVDLCHDIVHGIEPPMPAADKSVGVRLAALQFSAEISAAIAALNQTLQELDRKPASAPGEVIGFGERET